MIARAFPPRHSKRGQEKISTPMEKVAPTNTETPKSAASWVGRHKIGTSPKPPLQAGLAGSCAATPFGPMFFVSNHAPASYEDPPIVLLHGLVIAGRYMYPLAAALAQRARVYVPDMPGYGRSHPGPLLDIPGLACALAAFLDAKGIHCAHYVGNSFGCQVLAEFAMRFPERVDRLVFQGLTVEPEARSAVAQIARLLWNSRNEAPGLRRISLGDYRRAGLKRAIRIAHLALKDRIENKLPQVGAPTLLVRGAKDSLMPEARAQTALSLLPRGQLTVLADRGHAINYTAPQELAACIQPFLGLD